MNQRGHRADVAKVTQLEDGITTQGFWLKQGVFDRCPTAAPGFILPLLLFLLLHLGVGRNVGRTPGPLTASTSETRGDLLNFFQPPFFPLLIRIVILLHRIAPSLKDKWCPPCVEKAD